MDIPGNSPAIPAAARPRRIASVATRSAPRLAATAVLAAGLFAVTTPARAQTEIQFWFAMTGALGDRVNALAERFNKEQSEYKVVPTFKGSYPEALSAAIAG